MKKNILIPLFVALALLMGLLVSTTFMMLRSSTPQQTDFPATQTQRDFQDGARGRMGRGGMIGSEGMMGRMETFSFSSEYEFLLHMIPHHEEAVSNARILKANTEREKMEQFADTIIRTQSEEIEQMTNMLDRWYPERDHYIDYQPMMRDFENLTGEELDRAFLEDMIVHHMEAVMMSQQLISQGLTEHEEMALLANDIINAQRDEIHMMRVWLSQWY